MFGEWDFAQPPESVASDDYCDRRRTACSRVAPTNLLEAKAGLSSSPHL